MIYHPASFRFAITMDCEKGAIRFLFLLINIDKIIFMANKKRKVAQRKKAKRAGKKVNVRYR